MGSYKWAVTDGQLHTVIVYGDQRKLQASYRDTGIADRLLWLTAGTGHVAHHIIERSKSLRPCEGKLCKNSAKEFSLSHTSPYN